MNCQHKEIVMVNKEGKKCKNGGHELDFVIRCNICKNELFRISEYKRTIHNISYH